MIYLNNNNLNNLEINLNFIPINNYKNLMSDKNVHLIIHKYLYKSQFLK